MLLVSACAACGRHGGAVCERCARSLPPAPSLAVPLDLDSCRAALCYTDRSRGLLTSLKNGDRRDLVGWLADRLVPIAPAGLHATITWAPTSVRRRQARGYDQAELLARALARRLGWPCLSLLRRRPGPPQAGRRAQDRRTNPRFVSTRPAPELVVLVDDVATTGATLSAAATALREAGAAAVHGLVAARAPRTWR